MDVGNLISGSSAFSKPSLYIWKFSIHVLLKPSLKDFEYYLAFISHASKVMLKILQKYVNWGLPAVQGQFQRGRETRDQIANIHWITEKAREFQKNIYFCFTDYVTAFDCVAHNKLWKILKRWAY